MPQQDTKTGKQTELEERRAKVAKMYLEGLAQWSIAEVVGVDQSQVSRDLAHLRGEWRESAAINFAEFQARELARIDHMEAEAWTAWNESRKQREISTAEKTDSPDGARTKTGMRREGQTGDEGYLKVVQWCIDKRIQVLGFELPKKIALTNPDGTKEYGTESGSRPLAAVLAGARSALERLGQKPSDGSDGHRGAEPAVLDAADGPADVGIPVTGG